MTNPGMTSLNNPESPPPKAVAEFHRNSDKDSSFESQHHSLGMDRYQAARGDHTHDGTTGVPLLADVTITGNLGTTDLGNAVKKLLTALSDNLGLTDNTTQV